MDEEYTPLHFAAHYKPHHFNMDEIGDHIDGAALGVTANVKSDCPDQSSEQVKSKRSNHPSDVYRQHSCESMVGLLITQPKVNVGFVTYTVAIVRMLVRHIILWKSRGVLFWTISAHAYTFRQSAIVTNGHRSSPTITDCH